MKDLVAGAILCGLGFLAPVVLDGMPEDQPLGMAGTMTTRAEAEGILAQAFASPTPWEFGVLEVTSSGNVVMPERATGVFIAGEAPELAVPPRCRGDLHRLPHGATLVCFRDDALIVRLGSSFP